MFKGAIQPTLAVFDVVKSVGFYRDILGFEFRGYWDAKAKQVVMDWPHTDPPDYAEVYVGNNRLGIVPAPAGIHPGDMALSLHVDDIDALYKQLIGNGVPATQPSRQPWGATTMDVHDPDGYRWTFLME